MTLVTHSNKQVIGLSPSCSSAAVMTNVEVKKKEALLTNISMFWSNIFIEPRIEKQIDKKVGRFAPDTGEEPPTFGDSRRIRKSSGKAPRVEIRDNEKALL